VDLALEPFSDPRVRQAMSNLLDRDGLLRVHDSEQIGAWTTALPSLDFWWRDPKVDSTLNQYYAFDPARASQLLDAAGVDGISGIKLNTNIGYGTDFVEETTAIQGMLAAGGINLDINQQEQAEYYATTFPGKHEGSVGHNRMVGTTEPDEPLTFIYTGDSPRSGVPNGELLDQDEKLGGLLNAQRAETDRDARKEIIDDLQQHIAEQMYVIHGVNWGIAVYARPGLENVNWISTFSPEPTFHNAWFSDL
jgi:ABC-type transport system substrate-binding protein